MEIKQLKGVDIRPRVTPLRLNATDCDLSCHYQCVRMR
jgi:hypothetical protein